MPDRNLLHAKRYLNTGSIIRVVVLCALLVFVLYPFLWLLLSSLKYEKDFFEFPPSLFADRYTFKQYIEVWSRIPLLRFFLNTVIFATSVSSISIFFDSMAGYAFARIHFKGRKQLFILVIATMLIPFQIIMIPLFIEVHKLGILNTYAGLILPHCVSPFGIYMMRSFFVSLPKDLEEAARIDGLNEFKIYFNIMLPLCRPALITLFIFHFMYNWNDLLYPLMMTSSTEMRTLPAGLAMFVGERVIEYGPTLAGSAISLLPLLLAYIFAQKNFVRSIAMTGLKG
jgi:multiple sugar transport system permease protein